MLLSFGTLNRGQMVRIARLCSMFHTVLEGCGPTKGDAVGFVERDGKQNAVRAWNVERVQVADEGTLHIARCTSLAKTREQL